MMGRRRQPLPLWAWCLVACLMTIFCSFSCTASSYNAYQYDMTTPQFTPDGRLLQVEYAQKAATHSSPLLVVRDGDRNIICMAKKSSARNQDRLVIFQEETLIVMSGVLSDSLALLRKVQTCSENELRMYGTRLNTQKIASILGAECQIHSFGGGIRPYGSSMLVISKDTTVIQTTPSGSVKRMNDDVIIVGGTESIQAQLRSQVANQVPLDRQTDSLSETLQALAKILLEMDKDDDSKQLEQRQQWLEVAIVSPVHGVHHLSDSQTHLLMEAINSKSR